MDKKKNRSTRFFVRTTVEFKSELDRYLSRSSKYNTYTSLVETAVRSYITGDIDQASSSFEVDKVLEAIKDTELNIIAAIREVAQKVTTLDKADSSANRVVDEILTYLNLRDAMTCATDIELADLFHSVYHKQFVYDVIGYLQDAGYVRYIRDKLIWNHKKVIEFEKGS